MATNTYVALDKVTVAGTSTGTITFSSIPSTYTDLVIVGNLGSETTNAFPYLQFNGDTGNNYSFTQLYGNGASAYSSAVTGTSQLFNSDISVKQGSLNSNVIYNIMNYANTTTYKTSLSRQNTVDAADYNGALVATGLWRNTAAITSVSIKLTRGGTPYNFSNGSTFSLYGIAAQPVATAKATGGTITYAVDGYTYHTFTSSGTFTPSQALSCDVLVVAGGGSQGAFYGGGGGAGGLRGLSTQSMTTNGYTVTVGAGGAATSGASRGNQGTNSSIAGSGFTTISATGGGGGGGNYGVDPTSGGSGGGAGSYTTGEAGGAGNAGGYTPVEGYAGEACFSGNTGGAGGGASEAGGTRALGYGGNGSSEYSQWGLATNTGENVSGVRYYAGGGCGNSPARIGGYGGGGSQTGRNGASAWVGHANTGGGSGSAADNNGYAGGSGIVIIRYASA